MAAHRAVTASRLRRGVVAATGIAVAATCLAYGGAASASPNPTPDQVRQKISKLMSQLDAVAQQYDQSMADLKTASFRLSVLNRRLGQGQRKFETMRVAVTQIASAAYEQGDLNSSTTLIASDNPQTVLDRASLLNHLSSDRRAQMSAFLSAARALHGQQQAQQRATAAITLLNKNKAAQRQQLKRLLAKNQAQLNKLTAPPEISTPRSSGASSGGITYTGPAAGAARTAIQFALAQVGKPYVWGATGPDAYDCSGLVQAAWAHAGVSIPRTTYDMWSAVPHLPGSSIQPGDLLEYDAQGHVSMYIGNGKIVDAPQPGQNVEVLPMNASWYAQNSTEPSGPSEPDCGPQLLHLLVGHHPRHAGQSPYARMRR